MYPERGGEGLRFREKRDVSFLMSVWGALSKTLDTYFLGEDVCGCFEEKNRITSSIIPHTEGGGETKVESGAEGVGGMDGASGHKITHTQRGCSVTPMFFCLQVSLFFGFGG